LNRGEHDLTRLRIGAYGGTFDPIHQGHIEAARAVTENFGLDMMLLIPAAAPPHKDRRLISPSHHRFAMAAMATLDIPRVLVSTVELDSPDEPYTFSTLARLKASYGPDVELFFVVGADSFRQIHSWREPARLLAEANLVVVPRPGYEIEDNKDVRRQDEGPGDGGNRPGGSGGLLTSVIDLRGAAQAPSAMNWNGSGSVYLTDYIAQDVSSTEIRRRARIGQPICGMVAAAVQKYIEKYRLYRTEWSY
jgi:nicotinate-nucleotide adenylyltransferase